MMTARKFIIAVLCCIFLAGYIFAANVNIPSLSLFTKGVPENGSVTLVSEGEMDLLVEGGYKFGGRIILGFSSNNLEQDILDRLFPDQELAAGLNFTSASIVINEFLSLPLSFTYFLGKDDYFASGEDFDDVFGISPISTQYTGFFYFADGIRYDGIHRVSGTGIKLQINPIAEIFVPSVFLYQDAYFYEYDEELEGNIFDPGHYSLDVRGLLKFSKVHLEFFLGGTLPASSYGHFRAGLFFHAADQGGEFMAQIGIPRLRPGKDALGLELFFLLFEARLHLGILDIIPTVFLHPGFYLQNPTHEDGLLDFNLNFQIGDITESLISGGAEVNMTFQEENLQSPELKLSPYLRVTTPGVVWKFKINFQVFPLSISELAEGFIGVNAGF